MNNDSYFGARGIPEPFGSDLKHRSGIPKPRGDFGDTFEHLYEAYLVSIIAVLTGVLRELLFPRRTGFSTGKTVGKGLAAFVTCFTARRLFHYLNFKKREKNKAVMEKPREGAHLRLAQSA